MTLRAAATSAAKRVLPASALEAAKRAGHLPAVRRAARALAQAPAGPAWLDAGDLARLHAEFPPFSFVGDRQERLDSFKTAPAATAAATPAPSRQRATMTARAARVHASLNPRNRPGLRALEVGAGAGEVAAELVAGAGYEVVPIDYVATARPAEVVAAGVEVLAMNAEALTFADGSFDAVYSINTFEHVKRPDRALAEAVRVLRPGGRLCLDFAPIYHAPWGLHGWLEIGVPYAQVLFQEDLIRTVVTENRSLWDLNGWPLARYEAMFDAADPAVRRVEDFRGHDYSQLALIERFPSCFKAKADSLAAFTTSHVRYVAEKR